MDNVVLLYGVDLTPLKKIEHLAGNVLHGMKRSENSFAGFQEAYFSTIKFNKIKAWKFHLKISLKSSDLSKLSKIESNRKIYNILHEELKNEIHSLQILII